MKLHQSPERAPRLKASAALQQEPAEDFSFKLKIDIDQLVEDNKAQFYEDLLREGNRPLYYLNLLDLLSVLDPAEYERIASTDGHTFEYYKDQLHEQAMFTIPPAVRWLVRLFPESKADIAPIVLGLKRRIYRDLQRANLEREQLMNVISLGVNLLFLNPQNAFS